MAIFQPSNVIPDARSGIGLGVIDATQDMTVSWKINGQSALVKFQIVIYTNDASSTQKYSTGAITTGCPAYGTTSKGEPQFFSYTISASTLSSAGITNGNEYKLVITQWWSASDYVTQSSASAFITRAVPSLSIDTIGTSGVISARYYTFSGTYTQEQDDVLNWFRWRIAYADDTDNPIYDSENISGTMDISCYYDGLFAGTDYSIRLTCQTESGVAADTGWVDFSVSYSSQTVESGIETSCVQGTDAVLVSWKGLNYIIGVATGSYTISDDYILTLPSGSSVVWDQVSGGTMEYDSPWSFVWRGTLSLTNTAVFTLGQSSGNIVMAYDKDAQSISLTQGGTTLASQTGIFNDPVVTAILTEDSLYLRVEYIDGGLYPADDLYPGATVYPNDDTVSEVDTYTLSVSYTQEDVTLIEIDGIQVCEYFELIRGEASSDTIYAAIDDGDYVPGLYDVDYVVMDWTNGLNAGSMLIGDDTVVGFAIYRRQGDTGILQHIADFPTYAKQVYDYGALSQQGPYSYYIFPIGETTYISNAMIGDDISPCWWNWTLMECEETEEDNQYEVVAAYRFRNNIESGAESNNNTPSIFSNFTQYPTVQISPQNYKSGSLSGLIGAVQYEDGQPEYVDTLALRDAIYALSVTQNHLFLKSRKGDLVKIRISGAISMQTDDKTREQALTMTIPWVEVGNASNVSLYALQNKAVTP